MCDKTSYMFQKSSERYASLKVAKRCRRFTICLYIILSYFKTNIRDCYAYIILIVWYNELLC
jgi:hypothetical protein